MTMDTDLTHLLYFIVYQVFPYVVITVWLVGSFIRFLTHPYTVKSQSSELLGGKKEINWGADSSTSALSDCSSDTSSGCSYPSNSFWILASRRK